MLRQVPDDLLLVRTSPQTKPAPEKTLTVRQIMWLTLSKPELLSSEQTKELIQAKQIHPDLDKALTLAQGFLRLLRGKKVEALSDWLKDAETSSLRELRQFAQGIERDRNAVSAAISRPESNGPVEGQVTRLKLIKRAMYGLAKFDLLRLRVVHAA
jgi:transposase